VKDEGGNGMTSFLWFIIIGAAAGWLAGRITKGKGFGLIGNIVVGILGAVLGGWLFKTLGIYFDWELIGSLITAVIGAVILLYLISFIKKI
jgi:uncharacterized membrane protein YeaQ/YmgE (transglycosylase-associated protein family)